jgi:deazaflavin-dependent oxidoreductase (nitroreductase family)
VNASIREALRGDPVIDITTRGRRSGRAHRIEIWCVVVGGRYFITGTPGPRGWYANLRADPAFLFHVKRGMSADLRARALPVTDPEERRRVLSAPETAWYRDQVGSVEDLVAGSPLVEVEFEG